MNIREIQSALEYSREQFFQAKGRLNTATEPELIEAAKYEQMAWEKRCEFYHRKLREAVASGQVVSSSRLLHSGGKRYK